MLQVYLLTQPPGREKIIKYFSFVGSGLKKGKKWGLDVSFKINLIRMGPVNNAQQKEKAGGKVSEE